MVKRLGRMLASLVFLSLFYIFLYQIYSPRVNAFGCFDDCFNYVAGYFLLKGKTLYSQIFFNHQPLMAYLSWLIQYFTRPINIYELVLRHRQAIFLFGFFMNLLITWRFGLAGLGFAIFYETSKFYLFGDRFLAEGLIVYPLVYLTGLMWLKHGRHSGLNQESIQKSEGSILIDSRLRHAERGLRGNDKSNVSASGCQRSRLCLFDYLLAVVFVWLVVFMRLPFIPLTMVAFWLVIGQVREIKGKRAAVWVLGGLVLVTLTFLPIREYFFNIVTVNLETERATGFNFLKSFFYPLYLFWGGKKNIFRNFLVGLDVVFLLLLFLNWRFGKKKKAVLLMLLLLGLANLRVPPPGTVFYEAFHLLPWYGMLIFIIFLMLGETFRFKRQQKDHVHCHSALARPEQGRRDAESIQIICIDPKSSLGHVFIDSRLRGNDTLVFLLLAFLSLLFLNFTFSPQFFPREKIDPHEEFMIHFSHQLQIGEVVKSLSEPTDTLFLDGFDDLIYWQADRLSLYPYSWYTSVMPHIPKYAEARSEMFANNPPDFYYGSCLGHEEISFWNMPEEFKKDYEQLYSEGKPTCLYVRKEKIPEISEEKWQKAKELFHELRVKNGD